MACPLKGKIHSSTFTERFPGFTLAESLVYKLLIGNVNFDRCHYQNVNDRAQLKVANLSQVQVCKKYRYYHSTHRFHFSFRRIVHNETPLCPQDTQTQKLHSPINRGIPKRFLQSVSKAARCSYRQLRCGILHVLGNCHRVR